MFRRIAESFARDLDTERFVAMVRNTVVVAFVLVVSSEIAAVFSPKFPPDVGGTAIMAGTFLVVGAACFLGGSRSLVATLCILMFGVLGWYVARSIGMSGGVHSPHRGHRYAARSLRLLIPLARELGIAPLWITCDPENAASRRSAERAGATLAEIIDLPPTCVIARNGHPRKCRYRLD